jgi:hypothetical protein
VCEWIFRPLAHPLVLGLARLRVPPPLVVVSAGAAGVAAAVDLLVNAALFAALAWTTGEAALALAGLLALTSVLSLNFNAERLSRRGVAEPEAGGRATAFLRRLYSLVYSPQDRLAESLVARRPVLAGSTAVSLLANFGMSTQLAVFGVLIAAGHPAAFAWIALAEVGAIALALLPRRAPRRQEEIA